MIEVLKTFDELFPSGHAKTWDVHGLFEEAHSQDKSIEVRIHESGFDLSLVNPIDKMAFEVATLSEAIDHCELIGILSPLIVNIKSVVVPLTDFFSFGGDPNLGAKLLRAIYAHLLLERATEVSVVENASSRISLEYFYFVRWMFPDLFDRRKGEFEFIRSQILHGSLRSEDPFLQNQLSLIQQDSNVLVRNAMKSRLLDVRSSLVELL